jgi:hypothetical protein
VLGGGGIFLDCAQLQSHQRQCCWKRAQPHKHAQAVRSAQSSLQKNKNAIIKDFAEDKKVRRVAP